jgi:methionyl-tRNA synthetase
LFNRIKPEEADEWRKQFGSEETKLIEEEEAKMKAKKSAAVKSAKKPNKSIAPDIVL